MKKLGLIALLGVFLGVAVVGAEHGEGIFNSQGCTSCHKPAISKIGPSLKEITEAYQEKEDQLIIYLKGEAEPIMEAAKASMMKGPLEKTKSLSGEDRKALADFVMSHKINL